MEINKNVDIAELDNDKYFVDAANDAPHPQGAMTTNTAADVEEGRDDNDVGAEDGDDDDEVEDTKGGGGGDPAVEEGNDDKYDNNTEDVLDVMDILPPSSSP